MSIFNFGLKNRFFIIALLLAAFVLGIMSFFDLPRSLDTRLTVRKISIVIANKSLPLEKLSTLIGLPVEKKLRNLEGVKELPAFCETSKCYFILHLKDSIFDTKPYIQKIRDTLSNIKFPANTSRPIVDSKLGSTVATSLLALNYLPSTDIKTIEDESRNIVFDLQKQPAIERISVNALPERVIYIKLNTNRMMVYHLTIADLATYFKSRFTNATLGLVKNSNNTLVISADHDIRGLDDIRHLIIKTTPAGKAVPLSMIATVHVQRRPSQEKELAFFNGKPAVLFSLYPNKKTNQLVVGRWINNEVNHINATLPSGMSLDYITFLPDQIKSMQTQFAIGLAISIGILLLFISLFLDARVGLIINFMIPLILCVGFILLFHLGISLNRMTYAGLIIVLGLLLDNSLIFIDQCQQRIDDGEGVEGAVRSVNKRLSKPLLLSQLTTIVVFLPPLLSHNKITEFIYSLPVTIIVMLIASTLVRNIFLPSICVLFLRPRLKKKRQDRMKKRLISFLRVVLRFRYVACFILLLFIPAGYFMFKQVGFNYYKADDSNFLDLQANFQFVDSQEKIIHVTQQAARLVESILGKENIQSVSIISNITGPKLSPVSSFSAYGHQSSTLFHLKKPISEFHLHQYNQKIIPLIQKAYPGEFWNFYLTTSTFYSSHVVFLNLQSKDLGDLSKALSVINKMVIRLPKVSGVIIFPGLHASIQLVLNHKRCLYAGLSDHEVLSQIQDALRGIDVAYWYDSLASVPVMLADDSMKLGINQVLSATIYSKKLNKGLPLNYLAHLRLHFSLNLISIRKGLYTGVASFMSYGISSQNIIKRAKQALHQAKLSRSVNITDIGAVKVISDANTALFQSVWICLALFLLLLLYFLKSIRKLLALLLIYPLACCGGFVALWIVGEPFGFLPMLGLLALLGIVMNDGIILISSIDFYREQGKTIDEALELAVQGKFRSILLTSFSTALVLIPLYLVSSDFWLGIIAMLIGGVLFAGMLVLFVIPLFYRLFFKDGKTRLTIQDD